MNINTQLADIWFDGFDGFLDGFVFWEVVFFKGLTL